MPSGTPLIARGKPAMRSLRTVPRSGATWRSHRLVLPLLTTGSAFAMRCPAASP